MRRGNARAARVLRHRRQLQPPACARAGGSGSGSGYSDQYTRAQLAEALQLSVGTLGRYLRLYRTYQPRSLPAARQLRTFNIRLIVGPRARAAGGATVTAAPRAAAPAVARVEVTRRRAGRAAAAVGRWPSDRQHREGSVPVEEGIAAAFSGQARTRRSVESSFTRCSSARAAYPHRHVPAARVYVAGLAVPCGAHVVAGCSRCSPARSAGAGRGVRGRVPLRGCGRGARAPRRRRALNPAMGHRIDGRPGRGAVRERGPCRAGHHCRAAARRAAPARSTARPARA